jgi:hypothetical protein
VGNHTDTTGGGDAHAYAHTDDAFYCCLRAAIASEALSVENGRELSITGTSVPGSAEELFSRLEGVRRQLSRRVNTEEEVGVELEGTRQLEQLSIEVDTEDSNGRAACRSQLADQRRGAASSSSSSSAVQLPEVASGRQSLIGREEDGDDRTPLSVLQLAGALCAASDRLGDSLIEARRLRDSIITQGTSMEEQVRTDANKPRLSAIP